MKLLLTLVPFAMASVVTAAVPKSTPVLAQVPPQTSSSTEMLARVDHVDRNSWDQPTGAMLSARIHSNLKRDKEFKSFAKDIDVENRNGQITLKGTVPTRADELNVINKVRGMGGVAGVKSELSVTTVE